MTAIYKISYLLVSAATIEAVMFAVVICQGFGAINLSNWFLCAYIVISQAAGFLLVSEAIKILGKK